MYRLFAFYSVGQCTTCVESENVMKSTKKKKCPLVSNENDALCQKNYIYISRNIKPATVGAEATVDVLLLCPAVVVQCTLYMSISSSKTGHIPPLYLFRQWQASVFMRRFFIILCTVKCQVRKGGLVNTSVKIQRE